ncbi:PqqD family protein [Dermacoccaceae bacterium W4C1]
MTHRDYVAVLPLVQLDSSVLVLSGTARALWDALESAATTEAVVTSLASAYGTQPDMIRNDVVSFLDSLAQLGVVANVVPADEGEA